MISRSPVKMEFVLTSDFSILISLSPTRAKPIITITIPIHSLLSSFLLRKPIESTAVNIMTAPRNIWKLLAYVRFRPTYIIEVAHVSHKAGISRIKGLNTCDPLVNGLLSTELSFNVINL